MAHDTKDPQGKFEKLAIPNKRAQGDTSAQPIGPNNSGQVKPIKQGDWTIRTFEKCKANKCCKNCVCRCYSFTHCASLRPPFCTSAHYFIWFKRRVPPLCFAFWIYGKGRFISIPRTGMDIDSPKQDFFDAYRLDWPCICPWEDTPMSQVSKNSVQCEQIFWYFRAKNNGLCEQIFLPNWVRRFLFLMKASIPSNFCQWHSCPVLTH